MVLSDPNLVVLSESPTLADRLGVMSEFLKWLILSVSVCIYIYTHCICIYAMYIYIHINTHCIYIYLNTHTHTLYIYIYIYVHTLYVYIYIIYAVCMYIYTHLYIHTHCDSTYMYLLCIDLVDCILNVCILVGQYPHFLMFIPWWNSRSHPFEEVLAPDKDKICNVSRG